MTAASATTIGDESLWPRLAELPLVVEGCEYNRLHAGQADRVAGGASFRCMSELDLISSSFQSILLPVPEADAIVDDFRIEGDWSRQLGIPAHLTLAGPWPLSHELPRESLAELAAQARGTQYRLDRIDILGDAICLLPEDDRLLLNWRMRVLGAMGKPDEGIPTWQLHLTICRDESGGRLSAVRDAVVGALPLNCEVQGLCIARLVKPGHAVTERL